MKVAVDMLQEIDFPENQIPAFKVAKELFGSFLAESDSFIFSVYLSVFTSQMVCKYTNAVLSLQMKDT